MIESVTLFPGVTLRCYTDNRFKQGCLSFQLIRPMCEEEAALNALLPAVLLRGTRNNPDLRSITDRLDDLYGASVGALVRRIGDYQTTGLHCAFMEDRFALEGDAIFAPMVAFLRELLLDPVLEDGVFCREFVEGEKKNLIATIDSERNDKRAYASAQLLRSMCRADSFGVPRLGSREAVAQITPEALYRHYGRILRTSAIELFYVGSATAGQVKALVLPLLQDLDRDYVNLPAQTPFHFVEGEHLTEQMEITQAKLCIGFLTEITNTSPDFAAMQVFNTLFGGGMTSKLFMNVREKLSLCYSIGSGYYGSKGLVTVSAGIDTDKEPQTRQEILAQLTACQTGDFSHEELTAAKEAIISSLRGVTDSPGAIENYYGTALLSGLSMSVPEYMEAVSAVTAEAVVAAAKTVRLHSSFFLKGVTA